MSTQIPVAPVAVAARPAAERAAPRATAEASTRVAAIDWMRGFVMVLMIVDHASMAFDGSHLDDDSAMYPNAATMALPAGEFFTRWMTHICAPTFVFLAGVALALSIERKVAKGVPAWQLDKNILARGAIIALLDLTVISFGSGKWNFGVLFAIGVSMMLMAGLRRLPSWWLLAIGVGWFALGELPTDWSWDPPGPAPVPAALSMATYGTDTLAIKYPVLPWLAMMVLGWVFGRYMTEHAAGKRAISPRTVLLIAGAAALATFLAVRGFAGYGDMFLHRTSSTWQQWLHVSKYPPSLTYATLELGLLYVLLAVMMTLEPLIGVRKNGPFLVFGQTAMFFYLAHRLVLEIPATYFGLRGVGDLSTTYIVAAVLLVLLYPACLWYRSFKAAHPQSLLKYL
jgi:uncharacterized membrane protein